MQRILIVGLGNVTLPNTRHSVGHLILDSLAARCGLSLSNSDIFDGYYAKGNADLNRKTAELSFFKSKQPMNILGSSVGKVVRRMNQSPSSLIVIQDSLHHEPGSLKIKFGGSTEGHRGIRSVTKGLNHDPNYFRLLAGIGRRGYVQPYVLGQLSGFEKQHWSPDGKGVEEVWDRIEIIAKRMEDAEKSKEQNG